MTLLSRIDRFNGRHPWSHNDFYGGWVADEAGSRGARRVLDIGCGTGNLIDRLRTRVDHVTGIEPDPATARFAAARFTGDESIVIEQVRFDRFRSTGRWDAITLVASLHHLPLADTLRELDRRLSPGGRLVVIGCFRDSSPIDHATGLVAVAANLVIGKLKHPRAAEELPVDSRNRNALNCRWSRIPSGDSYDLHVTATVCADAGDGRALSQRRSPVVVRGEIRRPAGDHHDDLSKVLNVCS